MLAIPPMVVSVAIATMLLQGQTASTRTVAGLAGVWKYNEAESVNAATGRPESARAINERRGVTAGPSELGGGGFGNRGGGGGGARVTGGPLASPVDAALGLYIAQRDTRRDLLEIAPELRVDVADDQVTVTDDLERALVFPLDASKRKYQHGAATFEARTTWESGQLRNDIEGPDGLKMTQTWFVSEDGSKLFLVIRVGDAQRGARSIGVNRVYDRVSR